MELESVFKIEGREVKKLNNFLGFEVYEYDDEDECDNEIIHYLIKKNKVVGKIEFCASGGAYSTASGSIEYKEVFEQKNRNNEICNSK